MNFVICCSRWGWLFLERMWTLSGIQFTTHFIDFFVVETKRFVSKFCKRDLEAANLRPALEQGCGKQTLSARKLFSRANYMFLMSTDLDLSLLYILTVSEMESGRAAALMCH